MVNAVADLTDQVARAKAAFAASDYQGCVAWCRQILSRDARNVTALHVMGCAHFRLGQRVFGTAAMEAAVKLAPDDPSLAMDYGVALAGSGRREAGIKTLLALAEQIPHHPDLALRLVPLLRDAGHHDMVLAMLFDAVAHAPTHVGLRCDLATELASLLRLDDALIHLAVAEYLDPDHPAVQTNLGIILQARGDLDGAERRYRRALALGSTSHLPHLNLATVLLTRPDLDRGFAELEYRLLPRYPKPLPPRWRGERLDGRRLLVLPEQGLGDMIQFARFLPALAGFGGEVVVACDPELVRLFSGLPVGVHDISTGIPSADLSVSIMSLPSILKPTLAGLEGQGAYLPPPPEAFDLPHGHGLKVGLVWGAGASTKPSYAGRSLARRSCALEVMAPLGAIPGVSLFSLQKGPPLAQLAGSGLAIGDLSARLHDLADTAAAMAGLDLVISVDTSVAHLAGALGKPLWVLLAPGQADYRWGVGGSRTPWYPQARLFRATQAGWPALIADVADELTLLGRLAK